MKFFIAAFFAVIAVFICVQGYHLFVQHDEYRQRTAELQKQAADVAKENEALAKDIQFYQNPVNATKELQSKINYRKPDEQMIILVPPTDNATH